MKKILPSWLVALTGFIAWIVMAVGFFTYDAWMIFWSAIVVTITGSILVCRVISKAMDSSASGHLPWWYGV